MGAVDVLDAVSSLTVDNSHVHTVYTAVALCSAPNLRSEAAQLPIADECSACDSTTTPNGGYSFVNN